MLLNPSRLSKSFFALILVAILSLQPLSGKEGMWLPFLIGQLNADEMTQMGMQITADDIYSLNNSSLKDAIVHFDEGCTAELISSKGLILTNHHCGYGQIQSHSSLENNYLKNGFWAMSQEQELKNEGTTASVVKFMEDVTNEVLLGVNNEMSADERVDLMTKNAEAIIQKRNSEYSLEIKSFSYGNQYILIAKEIFLDVRLVGAPPSSIGKYGADTDNWIWPRHTGDFSIFRIYAGADNKPADISDDNLPYVPKQHLKVNIGGFEPGDFTLVYGFPGTTEEYLPSNELENIIQIYNPQRKAIRDELLAILDKKMRQSEETRIKYASKYARISNSWKRWSGEIRGLNETGAVAKKKKFEEDFTKAINANPAWNEKYGNVLPEMTALYEERKHLLLERYVYLETNYFGSELQRHILGYRNMVELYDSNKTEELSKAALQEADALDGFYKNYDAELDQQAMKALLPVFLNAVQTQPYSDLITNLKQENPEALEKYIDKVFGDFIMVSDPEKWQEMLRSKPEKAMKSLKKSEAYKLTMAGWDYFLETINPQTRAMDEKIYPLQAKYMKAIGEVFPDKPIYPDANSTLRVAYGKVQGYEPRDAVYFEPQTFLDGVIAKYIPGDYEFDLPARLLELYETKDYGKYAQGDRMPVCFIASNHTTGGNSGSPALNGRGELIGLNFDRAWEGTMSDYNYDISICRNIMVDVRYVLFIIDKFAGAGYLVDEMDLVVESPSEIKESAEPVQVSE